MHRSELRVRYGETDQMGVVYHAEYLVYCEVGRTDLIRAAGYPYAEMERQGVFLAVTEASLRFHAPARYDDRLEIETQLTEVRSRRVTFEYCIRHADTRAKLVTARTELVPLDAAGRTVALPPRLRDILAQAQDPPR